MKKEPATRRFQIPSGPRSTRGSYPIPSAPASAMGNASDCRGGPMPSVALELASRVALPSAIDHGWPSS
eukprot:4178293-Pyramimonas_sp.AAC.1